MRKNIFSWKSLAGLALLFGLTMGLSSCEQVTVDPDPSNPGTSGGNTAAGQGFGILTSGPGDVNLGLQYPSDLAKYFKAWLATAAGQAKYAALTKNGGNEITIYANTSKMTVRPYAKATATTAAVPEDATLQLDSVKIFAPEFELVTLILDGKFKTTYGTPLVMDAKSKYAAVYDITLPATGEESFDLDVKAENSAVYMQAPEGETATIGLLATWASTKSNAINPGDGHNISVKGLTLGEGLVVDAIAPQMGTVYVVKDAAAINAYGVTSNNTRYPNNIDKDFGSSTEGNYEIANVFVGNSTTKVKVNTVKVFAGDDEQTLTFGKDGSKLGIAKLVITENASVSLDAANVGEIEGANKSKSTVTFNDLDWDKNINNIKSISKVTIKNPNNKLLLNKNGGLPADIINDCIIFSEYVEVYPETELTNTTFRYTVPNAQGKQEEANMYVKVVPPAQSKTIPDYTYTFSKCEFQTSTYLNVYDADSLFAGATPIIDPETGEYAYRDVWHYAEYNATNGKWVWKTTYDESKIPAISQKLGYVLHKKEYFYSSTGGAINPKDIKDYDVTIALNECTVNGKAVTKKSPIFDIYRESGDYDINEKFAIDGKVYIPIEVGLDESEDGANVHPSLAILIAEE